MAPSRRFADKELERLVDLCVSAERTRTAFLQRLPDPGRLTDEERAELLRLDAAVRAAQQSYEACLASPPPPWDGPERRR